MLKDRRRQNEERLQHLEMIQKLTQHLQGTPKYSNPPTPVFQDNAGLDIKPEHKLFQPETCAYHTAEPVPANARLLHSASASVSPDPTASALAAVLARNLERRDIPGLPKFSDDVSNSDIHRYLGRNRHRSSETVLLTRCLKFLDFFQVFERLTKDLSDSVRCDALLKSLEGNVGIRAIQAGDSTFPALVARIRSWYLDCPNHLGFDRH